MYCFFQVMVINPVRHVSSAHSSKPTIYMFVEGSASCIHATGETWTCISFVVCGVEILLDAMKLHKMYFLYGSLLTSVVWLLLFVLYWNIQDPVPQFKSQVKLNELTSREKTWTQPVGQNGNVGSRKPSHGLIQNYSELPDLVKIALINNPEDQKHRNDGMF